MSQGLHHSLFLIDTHYARSLASYVKAKIEMERSYNSFTFNMQYHDLINQSPHSMTVTASAVVSPETVNNNPMTVATVDSSTSQQF